jgi:hypothetical protein
VDLIDASPRDGGPADAGADAALADDPFGEPQLVTITCEPACTAIRDPWLSPDMTWLYFAGQTASGFDLYVANRASPEADFVQAVPVGAINTLDAEHAPFLSEDGQRMWFSREIIGPPYDDVFYSEAPFDTAVEVAGVVDTAAGDERGAFLSRDEQMMLFARAPGANQGNHDIYLARLANEQWDTVVRVSGLDETEGNELAVWWIEDAKTLYFVRDGFVYQARWSGDEAGLGTSVYHAELDADPFDDKVGVWASPDGHEIWFTSDRTGDFLLYRAVR